MHLFTRGGYDGADCAFPAGVEAASRIRAQSFLISFVFRCSSIIFKYFKYFRFHVATMSRLGPPRGGLSATVGIASNLSDAIFLRRGPITSPASCAAPYSSARRRTVGQCSNDGHFLRHRFIACHRFEVVTFPVRSELGLSFSSSVTGLRYLHSRLSPVPVRTCLRSQLSDCRQRATRFCSTCP